MLKECQFALRYAVRHRFHTLVASALSALAIASGTVVFSIADALLFRSLPLADPAHLVVLDQPLEVSRRLTSADLLQERDRAASTPLFTEGAWLSSGALSDVDGGSYTPGQDLIHFEASVRFFDMLGVKPWLGRGFEPDDRYTVEPEAVIGYDLWNGYFHGDRDIIGRMIVLRGQDIRVLGVAPEGFAFPVGANIWTLLKTEPDLPPSVVRVGPNVSQAQVVSAFPRLDVYSVDRLVRPDRPMTLWLLLTAAMITALVAIFQVTSLQLTHALSRTNELTIRASLGANRFQLSTVLTLEVCLIILLAWLSAWAVIPSMIGGLAELLPFDVTRGQHVAVGSRAVLFSLALALFACAGAWAVSQMVLPRVRRASGLKASLIRTRTVERIAVVFQCTATISLMYLAGIASHSLWNVNLADLGVNADHVLVAQSQRRSVGGDASGSVSDTQVSLGRLPGVRDVARAMTFPLQHSAFRGTATLPLRADFPKQTVRVNLVTPNFFSVVGARFVGGTGFSDHESRQAVINEALAARVAHFGPVLGQTIMVTALQGRIVGIVHDLANASPDTPADPEAFFLDRGSMAQAFLVRVDNATTEVQTRVRDELNAINGGRDATVISLTAYSARATAAYRLRALLLLSTRCDRRMPFRSRSYRRRTCLGGAKDEGDGDPACTWKSEREGLDSYCP